MHRLSGGSAQDLLTVERDEEVRAAEQAGQVGGDGEAVAGGTGSGGGGGNGGGGSIELSAVLIDGEFIEVSHGGQAIGESA